MRAGTFELGHHGGQEAARRAREMTVIGGVVEDGIWMERGEPKATGGGEEVRAQEWGDGLNSWQIF